MIIYLLNVFSLASTALCLKQILVKTVPISFVAPVTNIQDIIALIMQVT